MHAAASRARPPQKRGRQTGKGRTRISHGPAALVSSWGYCSRCDGLTSQYGGAGYFCDWCQAREDVDRIAAADYLLAPEQTAPVLASVRPTFATVVKLDRNGRAREPQEGEALICVPARASRKALLDAQAAARAGTARLQDGWSLDYVFEHAALGRDMLCRDLEQHRSNLDRKTVAAGLDELVSLGVLERVGQLLPWVDVHEQDAERVNKTGAFTYRILVRLRHFGEASAAALAALYVASASYGGTGGLARAGRCLRWAVENAVEGTRNRIGHWLACRCIDAGLTEGDAEPVMRDYVRQVGGQGCFAYMTREAMRTLAGVYRRAGRHR